MLQRLRDAFWTGYIAAIEAWVQSNPPDLTAEEAKMRDLGAARAAEDIAAATPATAAKS